MRELRAGSAEFAALWASHDVASAPTLCTTFDHPEVGPVSVSCDVLDLTDRDQRIIVYTAVPGSPAEDTLRLLSVVRTQRMQVP